MFYTIRLKRTVAAGVLACVLLFWALPALFAAAAGAQSEKSDFIKWVDFNVPADVLKTLGELDIHTREDPEATHIGWIDALAYFGAKYGGDFSHWRQADLDDLLQKVREGQSPAMLGKSMKYYAYYREAYGAVLTGFLGEYELETEEGWESRYGWKAFSPIAKTFPYSDYDDFGAGRSYGYQRKHLGHDMMAQIGTPVIAVESGVVEALGWNQYGGWRVGVRSFDGRRYHYYAHLRKDRPFAEGLKQGQVVMAGDVIGYVGRTGYSAKENVNNINENHLHYGLQLIFDESQKEGNNEIWIDVYGLCRLLREHQSEVRRNDETKEWSRTVGFREEVPEDRFVPLASPAP